MLGAFWLQCACLSLEEDEAPHELQSLEERSQLIEALTFRMSTAHLQVRRAQLERLAMRINDLESSLLTINERGKCTQEGEETSG